MFIDTHAHVNFKGFEEDAEKVIQRALDAGVWVVNVGTQISTSREAVRMAEKFQITNNKTQTNSKTEIQNQKPQVYAVVGIHPVHTYAQDLKEEETEFKTREEKFDYEVYKKLASNPLVVGIGECGLDYFRIKSEELGVQNVETIKQLQKDAFIQQLRLAKELNKTLVIHSRSSKGTDDACLDILEILKQELRGEGQELRIILHSYTGSAEVAKEFVKLGAYLSFNGIITFDKTGNQEAVLNVVPNDKILLETDCPFLTPVPNRGKKNEPLFVKHVAEHIATLKNLSVEEVAELTTTNARKVYGL